MPRVTAAIPAYNAQQFVGEAIESVLAQTRPCDEVIVVDDGSTDDTAAVVRSYEGVRYVHQQNGGDAAARNRLAVEARGDLIAFLDADDVWLPRKIERQLECFEEQPRLGMVYTAVDVVDMDLDHRHTIWSAPGDVALRNTLVLEKPYMTGVGSSGMVPVGVARANPFDTRLKASADWAFACHIALRHPVTGVHEPLVLYRQHADSQVHLNLQAVEHDARLVFDELFGDPDLDPTLRRLARRARANLHLSLSASYFARGARRPFVRHLAQATVHRPDRVALAFWQRYAGTPQ